MNRKVTYTHQYLSHTEIITKETESYAFCVPSGLFFARGLKHKLSTIDIDSSSCNVAGIVTGQKGDHSGNVGGFSQTS